MFSSLLNFNRNMKCVLENHAYGKIKVCMPTEKAKKSIDPPRIIPSIAEGFHTVAANIYLILFPILIDLLLWLGPIVRIKNFFMPIMMDALEVSAAAYGDQAAEFITTSQEIWTEFFQQFNLLSLLRTFPIGISSLMFSKARTGTPFGIMRFIDLQSERTVLIWALGFLLIGTFLGCIYFSLTADRVKGKKKSPQLNGLLNQTLHGIILSLLIFSVFLILSFPIACILSSIFLFLPSLGTFPIALIGVMFVWMILPLGFSPHGIFSRQLNAVKSIVTSFQMVRRLMSAAGLFFIVILLIGFGLDVLWSTPETENWMLGVGIVGHAFISTGLLAASFVYYDSGIRWVESIPKPKTLETESFIS